jgi:hypothetical protein
MKLWQEGSSEREGSSLRGRIFPVHCRQFRWKLLRECEALQMPGSVTDLSLSSNLSCYVRGRRFKPGMIIIF